jgi:hypothetical protein
MIKKIVIFLLISVAANNIFAARTECDLPVIIKNISNAPLRFEVTMPRFYNTLHDTYSKGSTTMARGTINISSCDNGDPVILKALTDGKLPSYICELAPHTETNIEAHSDTYTQLCITYHILS